MAASSFAPLILIFDPFFGMRPGTVMVVRFGQLIIEILPNTFPRTGMLNVELRNVVPTIIEPALLPDPMDVRDGNESVVSVTLVEKLRFPIIVASAGALKLSNDVEPKLRPNVELTPATVTKLGRLIDVRACAMAGLDGLRMQIPPI